MWTSKGREYQADLKKKKKNAEVLKNKLGGFEKHNDFLIAISIDFQIFILFDYLVTF